jgi:hypothetical protein
VTLPDWKAAAHILEARALGWGHDGAGAPAMNDDDQKEIDDPQLPPATIDLFKGAIENAG